MTGNNTLIDSKKTHQFGFVNDSQTKQVNVEDF